MLLQRLALTERQFTPHDPDIRFSSLALSKHLRPKHPGITQIHPSPGWASWAVELECCTASLPVVPRFSKGCQTQCVGIVDRELTICKSPWCCASWHSFIAEASSTPLTAVRRVDGSLADFNQESPDIILVCPMSDLEASSVE